MADRRNPNDDSIDDDATPMSDDEIVGRNDEDDEEFEDVEDEDESEDENIEEGE